MSNLKPKVKISDDIKPVDLAIGGGLVIGGALFLALVFIKGSDSSIIKDIKEEGTKWGRKIVL